MKIKVYEVPVTLTRVGGEVNVVVNEDKKVFLREETPETDDIQMVPNIAKQLADHNNTQRTLVSKTMLNSEQESTGRIILKYLG